MKEELLNMRGIKRLQCAGFIRAPKVEVALCRKEQVVRELEILHRICPKNKLAMNLDSNSVKVIRKFL